MYHWQFVTRTQSHVVLNLSNMYSFLFNNKETIQPYKVVFIYRGKNVMSSQDQLYGIFTNPICQDALVLRSPNSNLFPMAHLEFEGAIKLCSHQSPSFVLTNCILLYFIFMLYFLQLCTNGIMYSVIHYQFQLSTSVFLIYLKKEEK